MRDALKKQAGFTLVEVLVSLFIFSILSASTLTVLTSTLQSKAQLAEKSERLRQNDILRVLLKADFENALLIPKTDEFGQPMPIWFAGGALGDNRVLVLSRTGWDNPGGIERRSNLQSVEYSFENGGLTRHVRPRFNALSTVPTLDQSLMKGIRTVNMTFFDGQIWGQNWLSGPPPQGVQNLPVLAAVELVFENGETLRQIFRVGADQ
ncbi:MAG: type II secretion system protein GspJ [Robiginitomaculum sp.]|nr:MAG: type II secretion system protein GspJ [Robiginitomaculum sp.]